MRTSRGLRYFNRSLTPWDTDKGRSIQLVELEPCFSGSFQDAATEAWIRQQELVIDHRYVAMCIPTLPPDEQHLLPAAAAGPVRAGDSSHTSTKALRRGTLLHFWILSPTFARD